MARSKHKKSCRKSVSSNISSAGDDRCIPLPVSDHSEATKKYRSNHGCDGAVAMPVGAVLPGTTKLQHSSFGETHLRRRGGSGLEQSELEENGLETKMEVISSSRVCRRGETRQKRGNVEAFSEAPSTKASEDRKCNHDSLSRDRRTASPVAEHCSSTRKSPVISEIFSTKNALELLQIFCIPIRRAMNAWDKFFHEKTDVKGCKIAERLRMCYSVFTFANYFLLGLDWDVFFLPRDGAPLIPVKEGRLTMDPDTLSIFSILPQTDMVYWLCYFIMMSQIVLLGVGVYPRFHAACVFFWHYNLTHQCSFLWDGEDIVFRMFSAYMIFFPPCNEKSWPMWPFRLMQINMCLIYISTGCCKLLGEAWRQGTALYYVVHLEYFSFGAPFTPDCLFRYMFSLKLLTWSSLALELITPILIWCDRYRSLALMMSLTFHGGIFFSMNLNFFHPIMIVGWSSFLIQPSKPEVPKQKVA